MPTARLLPDTREQHGDLVARDRAREQKALHFVARAGFQEIDIDRVV
jgi:hypothetical protein